VALGSLLLLDATDVVDALAQNQPQRAGADSARSRPQGSRSGSLFGSRGRADRFIDRMVDGEHISEAYGNVYIDRDTVTAAADTAYYYRDRAVYEFIGNVRLTRFDAVLTCRRAIYNGNFGSGDFYEDVRLVEADVIGTGRKGESRGEGRFLRLVEDALLVTPEYSVRADTIIRDRLTGTGEAFGHVRIMEPGALNLVTGDHATFLAAGEVAEVDRNPVLTSRDQQGGLLTSTAGLMRFFRQEDRVVMIDSVRINQGQTRARADTAVAYGRERMVLAGTPEVSMSGTSTMRGDIIEFLYRDGELYRVLLIGAARMEDATPDSLAAVYQGLPEMDVLEGDSITVEFEEEKIQRSIVIGNARSQYTPTDLSDEVATNDVVGDTITIDFHDERVHRVNVVGNMSGTYRFARIAAMREMLGRSRRLADMMARSAEDSSGFADSLYAAGIDSSIVASADSLMLEQADSMVQMMGLPTVIDEQGRSKIPVAGVDSLLTAALDSLAAAGFDTSRSAMDFLASAEDVKYSGRSVVFEMSDRIIEIEDEGELVYGGMKLNAEHIKLNTESRELYAEGNPVIEDNETVAGEQMGYDFGNRTGAVTDGVTSFDEYYYVGEEIRRFPDTTMKICSGKMTSCDLADPHYHFWGDRMKLRMEDKVVAAPIVLRVGRVPIFALPFYYKSLKSGRQSGILFPSFDFGWSSREGRYIRDFGYYWATNEYMDFIFEADFNENKDFGYRISNAYNKRYTLNGGIDYSRKIGLGDSDRSEWQLRWNHNQPTLFDDYKFRADVKLASTTLSSNDLNGSVDRDIVSGQLKSNVYLNRTWSFGASSLNASREERTNATDEDPTTDNLIYNMTLPSFSQSFRELTLAPQLRGGQQGSALGNMLRNTYFGQGYSFNAKSSGYELRDTQDYSAGGNWSLTMRPPRVGIFNVTFGSRASHSWTRKSNQGRVWVAESDTTGYFEDLDLVDESTTTSLSFNSSLGTALYGLFPVNLGAVKAIRHTFRFNTGWTLTPGIGSKQRHNTSFSFSVGNRFDLKYLGAEGDSTRVEKKLDGLVDWSLSTSFSPKRAAGDQWSDVQSSVSVKPGKSRYLQLKVNNSIDPKTISLISTSFSYGLSFTGKVDMGKVPAPPEEQRNDAIGRLGINPAVAERDSLAREQALLDAEFADEQQELFDGEQSSFYDFYDRPGRQQSGDTRDATEGGRYIPFDVNASFSYRYNNASHTPTSSGSLTFRTNLTRNWEFRYTASFDLVTGSPNHQRFSLNRDLHCWRFEFNRTINNVNPQFGFRIYLKAIPALKYNRGVDNGGGSLSGLY